MLKGLSRLWLRGMKRIGKAQKSQQKKILKTLLAFPTATKLRQPRKTAAVATRKIDHLPSQSVTLPGKWMRFYADPVAQSLALPALRMSYWLYLPAVTQKQALPLVVMLHGCRQTATQFAQGTRMNLLAERHGFAVLYPQQSLRSHAQRCWAWYDRAAQQGDGDVRIIAGIIEAVVAKYPIDSRRIYVAGLSAGAAMAHILALTNPEKIAAVGLHSGPVFGGAGTRMEAYAVMQSRFGKSLREGRGCIGR